MDKAGMRFEQHVGVFSACAPYRATVMEGQQHTQTGVIGNNIWHTQPPAGTIVAPNDSRLLFDFSTTVFKAAKNAGYQVAQIGKLINSYDITVPAHPYFCPTGIDRLHTNNFSDQTKGGGGYTLANHPNINLTAGQTTFTDPLAVGTMASKAKANNAYVNTDGGEIAIGTWITNIAGGVVTLNQPITANATNVTVHYTYSNSVAWGGWTIINDSTGTPVTDGPSVLVDGAPGFGTSWENSQNVCDWMADRFVDSLAEFTGRPGTDPRAGKPMFFWIAPPTPHDPYTPYPSDGNAISPAVKADRQARENFYNDWIPPWFDYRTLRVAATGGTYRIRWANQWTVPIQWNATALQLRQALETIVGAGNVTVTGGPGDADATTPYTVDFVGNTLPRVVPMQLDTANLTGRAFTASADIDLNDYGNGWPGFSASDGYMGQARNRLRSAVALDDMVETIINALTTYGQLNNTIIIYTSDNGIYTGNDAHSRINGKGDMYSADLGIPLMVRGPGIPANTLNNSASCNVQLTAYFLEQMHGTSIVTPDEQSFSIMFTEPDAYDNKVFAIHGLQSNGVQVGTRWKYWSESSAVSQSQSVLLPGVTGGTFRLTFQRQDITIDPVTLIPTETRVNLTTGPVGYNAGAAALQAEMDAIIGSGNSLVSYAGTTYDVDFDVVGGSYGNGRQVLPMLLDPSGLINGAKASVSIDASGAHSQFNLYRLDHDPFEMMNLAGRSEVSGIQFDLASRTTALQSAAGTALYTGPNSTYTG